MSRLDPKGINWGSSLDAQLERLIEQSFVKVFPKLPVRLPQFASTSLPDPARYEGCLIYCPDTQQVRASNGSGWSAL